MFVWDQLVEILHNAILTYAQVCGGNLSMGIVTVTFLVRMALFPLTFRLARLSVRHQAVLRRLKPELAKIRERFGKDPQRLTRETRRLFEREGISPVPLKGCLGAIIQMPFLFALFVAVRRCVAAGGRWLWIRNIAKPDFALTLAVTGIAYLTVAVGTGSGEHHNKLVMIAIPTLVTFFVLSKMAAGVGLYWGVSSLIGLAQALIIRRERLALEKVA